MTYVMNLISHNQFHVYKLQIFYMVNMCLKRK